MSQLTDEETEKNLIRFMRLISTQKIDVINLPLRLEKKQITERDRHYLGLILGLLNKLFGRQTTLSQKTRTSLTINHTSQTLFDSYESELSADALAARFQPTIDALIRYRTAAEKNHLLLTIETISSVLEDAQAAARLTLLWQCLQAAESEQKQRALTFSTRRFAWQPSVTAPPLRGQKKTALTLLTDYRQHLYRELRKVWPLHYYLSTHADGKVVILTRQGLPVREKNMTKNQQLLKQKCQAINTAFILLRDKHVTLTVFKHHFHERVRPVISQYRTPTDASFLVDMQKLLARFIGFFNVKGKRLSEKMAALSEAAQTEDKRLPPVAARRAMRVF